MDINNTLDTSNQGFSLWSLLTGMFEWFSQNPSNENPDRIIEGWTMFLNSAEEQAQKQAEKRAEETKKEISCLKILTNSASYRPQIIQHVQNVFACLDKDTSQILLQSRLDSSKRYSIIRDVVKLCQKQWLQVICQIICKDHICRSLHKQSIDPVQSIDVFKSQWLEQKYQKNICGKLCSLVLQASNMSEQSGCTHRILSDMLWSVYLSLSKELNTFLGRSLYTEENRKIYNSVIESSDIFVRLWKKVSVITGNISQREGLLPSKWEKEHVEHIKHLEQIKINGVDAKYNDGPIHKLSRSITKIQPHNYNNINSMLSARLDGVKHSSSCPSFTRNTSLELQSSSNMKDKIKLLSELLILRK